LNPEQEIGWYNLYIPNVYCKDTGMYLMTCSRFVEYQFGLQDCTMYTAYNHRWKYYNTHSTKTETKQTN